MDMSYHWRGHPKNLSVTSRWMSKKTFYREFTMTAKSLLEKRFILLVYVVWKTYPIHLLMYPCTAWILYDL